MKLALISDIHGNSYALKAVLDAVKQRGINKLLITGDFVGYYFWPGEVFKLLEGWEIVAIKGNHDQMLQNIAKDSNLRIKLEKKYGNGLNIALEQLSKKNLDWLFNLPNEAEYCSNEGKILLCHGSPWSQDEYIYPDADFSMLSRYESLNYSWVIQGHTHYPMKVKLNNTVLLNPGSVGQPRNGNPGAHWASLDTISGNVENYCESYDLSTVIRESKKRHPELPYLSDIFKRK